MIRAILTEAKGWNVDVARNDVKMWGFLDPIGNSTSGSNWRDLLSYNFFLDMIKELKKRLCCADDMYICTITNSN